ncbi:MAG: pentapeptide repeat-containing protein [Oscillatoriophycideae cyanobacterium NC_groundwater_1537_Pr4_S-0.65um_50_18]|nr:pentapeptide repeat-containing protein [Oscillatoriophycideae cyanobacterium NC_groundwater_1537_Pr4_S-0.65um_50_18]
MLPERSPLTLELLQSRLKTPTQSDGIRTIDLSRMVIDLRSEAFREQFYRLIQGQIQRSNLPLGLDLSYSLVQGEFKVSSLGLRTPLYGKTLPIFSEAEQAQLARDRLRLSQLSQLSRSLLVQDQPAALQITVLRAPVTLIQTRFEGFVNFTNTFFLGRVEAQGAIFSQGSDWTEARFSKLTSFSSAIFQQDTKFRSAIFFDRAKFNQAQFQGNANFQSSEFYANASFHQAIFQQGVNLTRIQWRDKADFAQTRWQMSALFDRSKFAQSLFLTEAVFEKQVSFRQVQFSQPVNLRGASILSLADFSDAGFAAIAYLNLSDLQFDPKQATILGNPGQIGRVISVPSLQGNEAMLRKLVQNFRQLQQISDANRIEYTTEKLRLQRLQQRILGTDLNTATRSQLQQIGFSTAQVEAIVQSRMRQVFRNTNDILRVEGVDLGTYVKVRDRIVTREPLAGGWLLDAFRWLGLSLLLLLTHYGTNFWLVFGVGLVAIAHFGILFWGVDRFRRLHPKPVVPTALETVWAWGGFSLITLMGIIAIFRSGEHPGFTLACLELVIIPIPAVLTGFIYGRGRFHDLMTVSYFVEDASLRQLRFMIGRLPNIPAYPQFRERYSSIVWDRRWSWLNYFDLSLNNLFRLGFNDIRLRDRHIPGLITALVWYQWTIGLLYFALLLWTLSRTIPGLNLLIYFK